MWFLLLHFWPVWMPLLPLPAVTAVPTSDVGRIFSQFEITSGKVHLDASFRRTRSAKMAFFVYCRLVVYIQKNFWYWVSSLSFFLLPEKSKLRQVAQPWFMFHSCLIHVTNWITYWYHTQDPLAARSSIEKLFLQTWWKNRSENSQFSQNNASVAFLWPKTGMAKNWTTRSSTRL